MSIARAFTALAIVGLCTAAEAQPSLERARAAVGTPTGPITLAGAANFLGAPASVTFTADERGRFSQCIDGPISLGLVYDGTTLWQLDIAGEVRPLVLGERTQALLAGWAITGRALAKGSMLTFGAETERGIIFTCDEGRISGEVEFDPATGLPSKWSATEGGRTTILEVGDYERIAGVQVPRTVSQTGMGEAGMSFHVFAIKAEAGPNAFATPAATSPATFDAAKPAALEVKRAKTGHLLVHPRVNGKDVGWFILDTGAGINVLAAATAKDLALTSIASIPATGVGGHVTTNLFRLGTIELGPMTISQPLVAEFELAFLDAPLGEHIAGIIGYGFLARATTEIDLGAATINVHNPATFTLEGAQWQELLIDRRVPAVHATFDGHKGTFVLDTGASGHALVFMAPTVQRLNMLEGRETKPSTVGGVGGVLPCKAGTLASFTLGSIKHENLNVAFATEHKGAFANPYIDGNIGGSVIAKYRMILDYPNGRIALIAKDK